MLDKPGIKYLIELSHNLSDFKPIGFCDTEEEAIIYEQKHCVKDCTVATSHLIRITPIYQIVMKKE